MITKRAQDEAVEWLKDVAYDAGEEESHASIVLAMIDSLQREAREVERLREHIRKIAEMADANGVWEPYPRLAAAITAALAPPK
jgi:hypothetical protein